MRAVPLVVFQLGHWTAGLSIAYLATHIGDTVYTWGLLYQVVLRRTEEAGYLPGWQTKTSGVLPRQQRAEWW
jgi:hypothetical protein